MKKTNFISTAGSLAIILLIIISCTSHTKQETRPKIYTTLFLTYDFAKAIAGDKFEVELFVPAGVDTHTYEPSASDMLKAKNAALFLWTSTMMEPWAPKIINSLKLNQEVAINLADALHLHNLNDEDEHHHDMHDHHDSHHHDGADPHFWMNPHLLLPLFDAITQSIIDSDLENRLYYEANAQVYRQQLANQIEATTQAIVQSKQQPLLFGGGFSHQYFIDAYGLPFYSVYMSDSIENEPTIAHMASIRQAIEEHQLSYIFVDPMLTTKIAIALAQDFNLTILPWHTGHTLSKNELQAGTSYLDLLYENHENLILALG